MQQIVAQSCTEEMVSSAMIIWTLLEESGLLHSVLDAALIISPTSSVMSKELLIDRSEMLSPVQRVGMCICHLQARLPLLASELVPTLAGHWLTIYHHKLQVWKHYQVVGLKNTKKNAAATVIVLRLGKHLFHLPLNRAQEMSCQWEIGCELSRMLPEHCETGKGVARMGWGRDCANHVAHHGLQTA